MRQKLCQLSFLIVIFAFSFPAFASTAFAPSFFFRSQKVVDNTGSFSNTDERGVGLDIKVGHVFDDIGLYLGGMYRYDLAANVTGDAKGYAFGPSVGYLSGAFRAILTYHFLGERKVNVGGAEKKLSQGKGLQIDIVWTPEITPTFGLGPQLTYQSLRFDRSQIGPSPETGNGLEDTTIIPGLALWFKF